MATLEELKRLLPKLKIGTFDEYKSVVDKDPFTLFFTNDTLQLFRGSKEYTKSVELVSELPAEGIYGKLYVVKTENSISLFIWDKTTKSFVQISEGTPELQKVLKAGSVVTDSQIQFNNSDETKTTVINESGILSTDTVDEASQNVSYMNSQNVEINKNSGSDNTKTIGMNVEEGFKDDKYKVLSGNPDVSRNLTSEEASLMRSRLNIKSGDEVSEEIDEKLKEKVDKGFGYLVKDFEIVINPEAEGNGFTVRKVRVDIDGNVPNELESKKLTAADMGLATEVDVEEVQKEIDSVKSGLVKLSVDFSLAFHDAADPANPTMAEVMTFLSKMGITPSSGTSLYNSKAGMSTYKCTFTFYMNPYDPTSSLILVNEGVLGNSIATRDELGVVKGSGDIRVDEEGRMFVRKGAIKPGQLSDELAKIINDKAEETSVEELQNQNKKLIQKVRDHVEDAEVHFSVEDREKFNKIIDTGKGNKVLTDNGDYRVIELVVAEI